MTTYIIGYLLIGWVLASLAYLTAGQYTPVEPGDPPKWVTVVSIALLWPFSVAFAIWCMNRKGK